jgi:hypothetical protein
MAKKKWTCTTIVSVIIDEFIITEQQKTLKPYWYNLLYAKPPCNNNNSNPLQSTPLTNFPSTLS